MQAIEHMQAIEQRDACHLCKELGYLVGQRRKATRKLTVSTRCDWS
jgi:hypothetical protein